MANNSVALLVKPVAVDESIGKLVVRTRRGRYE